MYAHLKEEHVSTLIVCLPLWKKTKPWSRSNWDTLHSSTILPAAVYLDLINIVCIALLKYIFTLSFVCLCIFCTENHPGILHWHPCSLHNDEWLYVWEHFWRRGKISETGYFSQTPLPECWRLLLCKQFFSYYVPSTHRNVFVFHIGKAC